MNSDSYKRLIKKIDDFGALAVLAVLESDSYKRLIKKKNDVLSLYVFIFPCWIRSLSLYLFRDTYFKYFNWCLKKFLIGVLKIFNMVSQKKMPKTIVFLYFR